MSAVDAARDHYLARHAAFAETLPAEPAALATLRREALAAFADAGLPRGREEEWRYTNVAPIAKVPFEVAAEPSRRPEAADLAPFALEGFESRVFVFVNGRFAPELGGGAEPPGGIRVESLRTLRGSDGAALVGRLGALADPKENAFAALNTAFADDGAVVRVPRGADVGAPLHLFFVSLPPDTPEVVHPRVLVVAGAGSRVSVVQDHVSFGDAAGFSNPVTEIHAEEDAAVDFVLLQREPDRRFHVSNVCVRQERSSRVSLHTLCLGGALVRNDAKVVLAGEGAECRLHGLFLGGGRQLIDNHTLVDHAVPHCASRELYKGILGGAARGVFRGRVVVRPDAQKTRAEQSNPNLLTSRGAEIDTKPQLEIYADDVKCSHGSSIGRIDPEALYYLRTRGIPESEARDLLTRAFGVEILDALPAPGLGAALDGLLLERLRHARLSEET